MASDSLMFPKGTQTNHDAVEFHPRKSEERRKLVGTVTNGAVGVRRGLKN